MEVILAWYPGGELEKTKGFYAQVLGLKKSFEMPGWAEFTHKEGGVSIGLAESPHTKVPGAIVVLRVENIESEYVRLKRAGVQFEEEIREIPGVVKLVTFVDPAGNRLQLAQPLTQSPMAKK